MVLSLGGGAVMTSGSAEMVHNGSLCIYLRTSVDELVSRLSSETSGRPLLKSSTGTSNTASAISSSPSVMSSEIETSALRTRILDLMSRRASTYEHVAHIIIDTDGKSIDQIATEITETIK